MDKARAYSWFAQLVDTSVDGWVLEELAGFGKSAIVTKVTKDGSAAALKIFEPELVERFGLAVQLERIRRETSLVGKTLPNLVSILGGGQSADLLYVAMEYLPSPWRNLASCIAEVPRDRIWPLISAVAEATRALENLSLAHRDIKPENIMVAGDFSAVKLMDLGVVRPIGTGSITDNNARPFIGTLRYSSPEFLLRQEEDTILGWRAVTFYQLGGVLHDLIMRRPLFAEFSDPYARLVKAVEEHIPTVDAPDVHTDLLFLCRNCLLKDPKLRLQCVTWEQFDVQTSVVASEAEAARERVKTRKLLDGRHLPSAPSQAQIQRKKEITKASLSDSLKSVVREVVAGEEFPLYTVTEISTGASDRAQFDLVFEASPALGLNASLRITFAMGILDGVERVCRIDCLSSDHGAGGHDVILFTGVFDHEVVRTSLRDHLYVLIDRVQQE